MIYLWVYNHARRRHERWARNPADPEGVGRLVAVQGDPRGDHSDLPADVQFTPYAADTLTALASGDPALINSATDALNQYDRQSQGQSQQGQGTGGDPRAVRDSPEMIGARTHQINTLIRTAADQGQIDQARYLLEQEMRERGQNPADYFGRYQQPRPAGGAPTPDATGVAFPPAYLTAYTEAAAAALRGDQLTQKEYLQQVANAWEQYKTGADRLQTYGDAIRERDKMAAQYALDEQQMAADPGNDRRLRPMADGQWAYDNLRGSYGAMQDQGAAIERMTQQWYPEQWHAEQRRRQEQIARAGGAVHNSWGIDPNLPRYAEGGQTDYYQPFSSYAAPGAAGNPYAGFHDQQPTQANSVREDEQAYRQQTFSSEMEQREVQEQLNRIQQQAQFEAQQLQAAHQQRMAALQQRYTLLQTEVARQRSQAQQRGAMARAEYPLTGLVTRPGGWAG